MCSFNRSTSTWPGMRRSPVNSATRMLHQRSRLARMQTGVHLDPAGEVNVSVDYVFRAFHLQGNRVVDPVADGEAEQRAVGNGGRKRERRRIQFGQVDMKIDSDSVSWPQGRQVVAFAGSAGPGEIDAHLVAQHEADDRPRHVGFASYADPHQNARLGLEQMKRLAVLVQHADTEYFSAAIAMAVIDVGDGIDEHRCARRVSLRSAGSSLAELVRGILVR